MDKREVRHGTLRLAVTLHCIHSVLHSNQPCTEVYFLKMFTAAAFSSIF